MLHLPGKDFKPIRNIGYIEKKTLHLYRSGGSHFHRNTGGSVGICYKLLKDYSNHFHRVCIQYNDKTFFTDRDFLLHHGTFRNYQSNGLERQIFVRLEDLEPQRQAELRLKQIKLSKMQQAKQMQPTLF